VAVISSSRQRTRLDRGRTIWLGFEGIDPSIFWEGDRAYVVNNGMPNEVPRYEGHRAI
jgi:xylan 1,4-beta-xylosidase